jgi:hypothetical protein
MKNMLWIYLLIQFLSATGQEIDWQKASDWKIYKVSGDKGLGYSVDTLRKCSFIEMMDDSVHYFMKQVEALPKENPPVWMGAYYASCVIESKVHKIDISVYGGFFYDELTHRYYRLPMHLGNDWMDWLNSLKKRVNAK